MTHPINTDMVSGIVGENTTHEDCHDQAKCDAVCLTGITDADRLYVRARHNSRTSIIVYGVLSKHNYDVLVSVF